MHSRTFLLNERECTTAESIHSCPSFQLYNFKMVLLKVPHVYLPIVQFRTAFSSGRSVFGEIAEIDVISETLLPVWEDARPE